MCACAWRAQWPGWNVAIKAVWMSNTRVTVFSGLLFHEMYDDQVALSLNIPAKCTRIETAINNAERKRNVRIVKFTCQF